MSPSPIVEPINSLGNCYAILLVCAAIIAALMLRNSKHLSHRIQNARKKADERRWVNQMEDKQDPNICLLDISTFVFTAEPNDRWHTRPLGITVLTVGCSVLAQIVNLRLGLI